MAKGYTTAAAVAALVGVSFTTAQTNEANALLDAAEAAIDSYCDHVWAGGAIAGEVHIPEGPLLYLRQWPVASITQVVARWYFATPPVTLTAGADYYARDLAQGLLVLTPWRTGRPTDHPYETVEVSYVPVSTVPADVALAASLLVAHWLGFTTQGAAVVSKRVGDVEVRYGVAAASPGDARLPAAVQALLAPWADRLVFA